MQAKKRYLLAAFSILAVLICYYGLSRSRRGTVYEASSLRSFIHDGEAEDEVRGAIHDDDVHKSARSRRSMEDSPSPNQGASPFSQCRMETCFNYDRCQHGFKVYVYPVQDKISAKYSEILSAFRESKYYTAKPDEACIFVLSIDTLDRDVLSTSYVHNIPEKIRGLELWNNGENHVVFNLYAGTWPDYTEEDLGFDIGKAILAKASFSYTHYRPGYDISLPLFHKEHPYKGGEPGYLQSNSVPPLRKYTLAFKGKRYLTGIGSESRNSLYHIHNGEDIILLTTCKHGKVPKNIIDERCSQDDAEYDKWDYKILLHNSTFCLVPRGRRLGSFRFLETLQAACIPVLLSNGWVLPFVDRIDWNKVAVWGDERLLLQVPSIVRSIPNSDILLLRQQTQFLWDTYFSSMEKIIQTTLEVLRERVMTGLTRSAFVWNTSPGALAALPEYWTATADLSSLPFYWPELDHTPPKVFTALVYSSGAGMAGGMGPSLALGKLLKALSKSAYLEKIVIVWHCDNPPVKDVRWSNLVNNIPIVFKVVQSLNQRFYPFDEIETEAVFTVDEDAILTTDEVDFALHVWQYFPQRIVGYAGRTHFWDEGAGSAGSGGQWGYTSKPTNTFSMVLTDAAFIHRYYLFLYTHSLSSSLHSLVHDARTCEDLLMNMLLAHVTKLPPIKLTQRHTIREAEIVTQTSGGPEAKASPDTATSSSVRFALRQKCLNQFAGYFGYMPLVRSTLRLDPILYKDPVSILRKKYRQIERV